MNVINRISRDYNILKSLAFKYYDKGEYLESLNKVAQAAKFGYVYSANDEFGDVELDDLIAEIAKLQLPSISLTQTDENKVVFYDYFAWDNRGLTQQYLTALENLDYEILFITRFTLTEKSSKDILTQLSNNNKITHYTIQNQSNDIEAATEVLNQIEKFKPAKAFLHLSPWDNVAFLSFSRLDKQLIRYFINLTDHTYWLGNNIIDICLEFRNFGYQLSTKYRNIPKEKCVVVPYYPIMQTEDKFDGLPLGCEGKMIAIAAGSAYKFKGEDAGFYKLIHPMLAKHKNLCLIIVGAKELESDFMRFAKEDEIANQLIFLDNRRDISQLIKHADIFICSFPIGGGLITQMAAEAGLPILAYTKPDLPFNLIEDLIPHHDKNFKTFIHVDEFLETASRIIDDKSYRLKYGNYTNQRLVSKDEFNADIASLLKNDCINKITTLETINFNRQRFTTIIFQQGDNTSYLNSFSSNFNKNDIINMKLINSIPIVFNKMRSKIKSKFFN